MKNTVRNILITLALITIFSACEKEKSDENILKSEDSVYLFVNEVMKYWYYWNNELIDVDYLSYDTPQELLSDLMVEQDRWSFIDKTAVVEQVFQAGEEFGFGFYLGVDNLYNLRVMLAYENSEAYKNGVRRGWILEEIDNVNVRDMESFDDFFSADPGTMKFKFIDESSTYHTMTLDKELFNLNAVFNTTVYDIDGKTTGYFAFQSFLGYAEQELIIALNNMKEWSVDELIIDLRFNSGGYISLAQTLADILVPTGKTSEIFYEVKHNSSRSEDEDLAVHFGSNSLNLGLEKIYFITNEYSASASELIINGLEPHMDVYTIGQTTAGKPYAMYGFQFQDWLAYPVCAKSVNADGFGDYEDGIVPDILVEDYHTYNWGDVYDPAISQAVNHIKYGSFGAVAIDFKGTSTAGIVQVGNSFKNHLLIMDK